MVIRVSVRDFIKIRYICITHYETYYLTTYVHCTRNPKKRKENIYIYITVTYYIHTQDI